MIYYTASPFPLDVLRRIVLRRVVLRLVTEVEGVVLRVITEVEGVFLRVDAAASSRDKV